MTLTNVYQDVRWISIPEFTDPNFFPQMQKLRVRLSSNSFMFIIYLFI
jgi:hypothetical protein